MIQRSGSSVLICSERYREHLPDLIQGLSPFPPFCFRKASDPTGAIVNSQKARSISHCLKTTSLRASWTTTLTSFSPPAARECRRPRSHADHGIARSLAGDVLATIAAGDSNGHASQVKCAAADSGTFLLRMDTPSNSPSGFKPRHARCFLESRCHHQTKKIRRGYPVLH